MQHCVGTGRMEQHCAGASRVCNFPSRFGSPRADERSREGGFDSGFGAFRADAERPVDGFTRAVDGIIPPRESTETSESAEYPGRPSGDAMKDLRKVFSQLTEKLLRQQQKSEERLFLHVETLMQRVQEDRAREKTLYEQTVSRLWAGITDGDLVGRDTSPGLPPEIDSQLEAFSRQQQVNESRLRMLESKSERVETPMLPLSQEQSSGSMAQCESRLAILESKSERVDNSVLPPIQEQENSGPVEGWQASADDMRSHLSRLDGSISAIILDLHSVRKLVVGMGQAGSTLPKGRLDEGGRSFEDRTRICEVFDRIIAIESTLEDSKLRSASVSSPSRGQAAEDLTERFSIKVVEASETGLMPLSPDKIGVSSSPGKSLPLKIFVEGSQGVAPKLACQLPEESLAVKTLHLFDRWGEPSGDQMPRTIAGGLFGILLLCSLAVYAVFLFLNYETQPLVVTSEVHWSISWGPYPLPITCYAQECLVSFEYGSVSNTPAEHCLAKLPSSQVNKCIRLGRGEQLVLQTCYSLLPMQGVHVHFGGPRAWLDLSPKLHRDLGLDANSFGFATVSDMLGMMSNMPVMAFPTPIKSGRTVLDYVKTVNNTIQDGNAGALRHEWFSQYITDEVSQWGNGSCAAVKASISQSQATDLMWQHAVLSMAPQYTQIHVEPPMDFVTSALGEVGGALELGEQILMVFVLAYWKFASWGHRSQGPAAADSN